MRTTPIYAPNAVIFRVAKAVLDALPPAEATRWLDGEPSCPINIRR